MRSYLTPCHYFCLSVFREGDPKMDPSCTHKKDDNTCGKCGSVSHRSPFKKVLIIQLWELQLTDNFPLLSQGFLGSPSCWLTMARVISVQCGPPVMSYLCSSILHWFGQGFVICASQSEALLSSPASQSLSSGVSITAWRLCLPHPASSVLPSMGIYPPISHFALLTPSQRLLPEDPNWHPK